MEEGDRYTLGLLLELRKPGKRGRRCEQFTRTSFPRIASVRIPSHAPEVAKELPFKVRQFVGRSDKLLRTVSLNGNIDLAKAAFDAAKKIYPEDRFVLLWGSWVIEDSMPIE